MVELKIHRQKESEHFLLPDLPRCLTPTFPHINQSCSCWALLHLKVLCAILLPSLTMFNSDISLEILYGQSNRLVATELFKFPNEAMQRLWWLQEKKKKRAWGQCPYPHIFLRNRKQRSIVRAQRWWYLPFAPHTCSFLLWMSYIPT